MTKFKTQASLEEARAQYAERILERRRMGMEFAVEALESVGYIVMQDEYGHYHVDPPVFRVGGKERAPEPLHVPQSGDFLAEYPNMLSTSDIAEITGLSMGRVSKMCQEQKLPAVKIGNNRWYVPKPDFIEMTRRQKEEAAD